MPLKAIVEVHLYLEAAILKRYLPQQVLYSNRSLDDHISSMLAHMADESVMQGFNHVYTDLTTNTLRIMKPD